MPSIHILPDDRVVETAAGESILQASLRAGIPHTHVCGGKARCTTCRFMLLGGDPSHVSAPTEHESLLAEKLGFPANVRLACQSYISGDVKTRRLVIDDNDIDMAVARLSSDTDCMSSTGIEKEVIILFADIRDFTSFSDRQLPYDIVHMLNRYFYVMRNIIERYQGSIYNYMGDGLLALFGVGDERRAADNAVRCGLEMLRAMDDMQPYLQNTYRQGLQIGVGIHCGEVVIGSIDDAVVEKMMVIGDAVNFASRVESANRDTGTRLLISQPVYDALQEKPVLGRKIAVEVKGKSGKYRLYEALSFDPDPAPGFTHSAVS